MAEIIGRILDAVLMRAVASLTDLNNGAAEDREAAPHRFDFVHDAPLRPVLEAAYAEGRRALEQGHFSAAFITACSLLEAVVTDALTRTDRRQLAICGAPAGSVTDWPFETRLAAAERAGLIRGGCARLPPRARRYRDLTGEDGDLRAGVSISEREARLVGQVLHVIMRDLDPGR